MSAVGITLSRAEVGGMTATPTPNTEAYLLYLQGLEYAGRPGDRREDLAMSAAIERLLAGRSRVSVHTLRLDPLWDPIRRDPRLQALLVKHANPGS